MGLFKSIGRAIGIGLEKVGQWTGSEMLEDWGRDMQYACIEVSESTGNTASYNKEKAKIEETERINSVLSEFSLNLEKKADQIECEAISESNIYFKKLIEQLSKSNISINISSIERSMSKVERKIKGNLKNHISKKVSIDDNECLEILKLDAGLNKEKQMKKFSEEILQQGLKKLTSDVNIVINEQKIILTNLIQDNINSFNLNLNKQMDEFKLLENTKLKSEEELNQIKSKLNEKIKLSEACLNALI